MTPVEIKRTTGYFTGTETSDFPLDCNGMEDMQANESLLAVLGNIGGGQYILSAPTVTKGGYIFLSTEKEPAGELLYIERMDSGLGTQWFYVHEEWLEINAQGIFYPRAYLRRWLKWGQGNEKYRYSDFKPLQTNKQLTERCDAINTDISNLSKFVRGMIMMWNGNTSNIPPGWALCDGSNSTPNLQGRFIVGSSNTDSEYAPHSSNAINQKQVKLNSNNLPSHQHELLNVVSSVVTDEKTSGVGGSDSHFIKGYNYSDYTGENSTTNTAFDIRPSYYALCFIMKL